MLATVHKSPFQVEDIVVVFKDVVDDGLPDTYWKAQAFQELNESSTSFFGSTVWRYGDTVEVRIARD